MEKAQRAFDEFLAGERSAGNVAVKDIVESAGGEVVRSILQADRESFFYWQMQPSAEVMVDFSFGRVDIDGNGIYDSSDIYEFDMRTVEERYAGLESEQNINMEGWLDMVAGYLYIDENGRVQLLGRLGGAPESERSKGNGLIIRHQMEGLEIYLENCIR